MDPFSLFLSALLVLIVLSPIQKSRAALERYLFYCNRYMNHLQSSRMEAKLHEQVHKKMQELQQLGMTWVEVQFMSKAVEVLCQCRQTLMYTYAFAFYLKKNNQTYIFEVRLTRPASVILLVTFTFVLVICCC